MKDILKYLALAALLVTIGIGCAPEAPPAPVEEPVTEVPLVIAPEFSATSTLDATPSLRMESVTTESYPYVPPPSINLTGSSLGRQRVPGTEGIGDIQKLYYHTPTLTLFMAVKEPDGLRSVWKLTEQGKVERVFAASASAGELRIFGDSKGVIYAQQDNPVRLFRSDDGLKTWRAVLEGGSLFWDMADDGFGNVYATTHDWNRAVVYRSPNDGFNWEPWKDFHELFPEYAVRYREGDDRYWIRHLHGVIFDQAKKQIIVGTGDVARFAFMTDDDGKTWKEVWDEGFTSHAQMSGGFRHLLGPDQLQSHGIVIYDAESETTEEVWNPIPYGWSGYVYSILNVGGVYYAGVHTEANEVSDFIPKFGVIVSPNGYDWYPFLEYGPLTNHARTDIWLAQGPNIIYASVNGSLYALRPLGPSWFAGKTPFTKE